VRHGPWVEMATIGSPVRGVLTGPFVGLVRPLRTFGIAKRFSDAKRGPFGRPLALAHVKQRVWREGFRAFHLNSYQLFGLVGIFLAAIVAPDLEVAIHGRGREKSIGFSERNLVGEEEVLLPMKSVILAEHDPKILTGIYHYALTRKFRRPQHQ
jgi:hypothetical protein